MILLDTNILARLGNKNDPDYKEAGAAVAACWRRGLRLCISSQTLQEFWVVATRSVKKNGLEMPVEKADRYLGRFRRSFVHLADPPGLFDVWHKRVTAHRVTGIRTYDARLAAFVQAAGLDGLMTYNAADFADLAVRIFDPRKPSTW